MSWPKCPQTETAKPKCLVTETDQTETAQTESVRPKNPVPPSARSTKSLRPVAFCYHEVFVDIWPSIYSTKPDNLVKNFYPQFQGLPVKAMQDCYQQTCYLLHAFEFGYNAFSYIVTLTVATFFCQTPEYFVGL